MLATLLTTFAFALAEDPGRFPKPAPVVTSGAPVSVAPAPPDRPDAATDIEQGGASPAFAGLSDEKVAQTVLDYLNSLTTLSGTFVQTAPSGAVATGKFYLRRPGQVRFDYDAPSPITIVATQGMVYVQNSDLETTDSYPLKKTPLRFLLAGEMKLADATLRSVARGADRIAVTFAAADSEIEGEITLILSAPALSIEAWTVKDAQEGVTVVALQDVRSGDALENRLFRAPEAGGAFIRE